MLMIFHFANCPLEITQACNIAYATLRLVDQAHNIQDYSIKYATPHRQRGLISFSHSGLRIQISRKSLYNPLFFRANEE